MNLKKALQYYIGFGFLDESDLQEKVAIAITRDDRKSNLKLKHEPFQLHFDSKHNLERIQNKIIIDMVADEKGSPKRRTQTEEEIEQATRRDNMKKANEEIKKILILRIEEFIEASLIQNAYNSKPTFFYDEFSLNKSEFVLVKHEASLEFKWNNNTEESKICFRVLGETMCYLII